MSGVRNLLAAVAMVALTGPATADMGRVIAGSTDVKVTESSQKAIILHNRREEVLILGTEIGASKSAVILRFIPFPAEPKASLAPADAFTRLSALVGKYHLRFVTNWQTKGPATLHDEGVSVVSVERLGSHDLTTIRISDAAAFRSWVNDYFKKHHLPTAESYKGEEAIVADYVRRGHDYFVIDRVDLGAKPRFIEPLAFRFPSPDLYYPLVDTNSFGGKGTIDLFVVAPVTLCRPGSNDPVKVFRGENVDLSADPSGMRKCLDLDAKASTSSRLVPDENDLDAILPDWRTFFGDQPMFLQAIRRVGDFQFKDDVHAPLVGEAKALEPEVRHERPFPGLNDVVRPAVCDAKPVAGPCKAAFPAFWFDAASGHCKEFLWGGCGPSKPFETQEECEKACGEP